MEIGTDLTLFLVQYPGAYLFEGNWQFRSGLGQEVSDSIGLSAIGSDLERLVIPPYR